VLCKFGLEKPMIKLIGVSFSIYLGDVVLGRNEELG
jgi:hypothetical protein